MSIIRISITAFLISFIQLNFSQIFYNKCPFLVLLMAVFTAFYDSEKILPASLFLTGLIRDLFLGVNTGVSSLSFIMTGFLILFLKNKFKINSLPVRIFVFLTAIVFAKFCEFLITAVAEDNLNNVALQEVIIPIISTLIFMLPAFWFFKKLGIAQTDAAKGELILNV